MAFDRNRFRQGLTDSAQRSSDSVEDRGGFKSYVKKGKRPRFTKIPEGTLVFDIIPYIVGNDFGDTNRRFTKDSLQHNLDLYVHQNIGVNNDQVVCLAKTFGKPCPICEEIARREAQGEDRKALSPIAAKRRCLYNIWIHDPSRTEENKGVQILEIAHFTLEKNLIDIARNPITGAMTVFADPDTGKHVCLTRKGTGMNNTTYSGHQLIDRQAPVPDTILEQAEDLTTLVEVLSYEELAAKFHGTPVASATSYGVPTPPSTGYPTPSVAGGSEQYGNDEVPFTPNVPPYNPAQSQQFSYGAPVPPVTAPAPAMTAEPTCPLEPYGGKFGVTLDKFPQCGGCSFWDACAEKYDANH